MLYNVTKQYGRGAETIAGSFSVLSKAKEFMQQEAKKDAQMKIQAMYRIYEFDEVIEELNSAELDATPHYKQQESQGGTAGKGAGFRPTPLGVSPKPKGSIHHSQQDDDGDEKKK